MFLIAGDCGLTNFQFRVVLKKNILFRNHFLHDMNVNLLLCQQANYKCFAIFLAKTNENWGKPKNVNYSPHLPQTWGFVLECVWTCARRFDLSAKAFPQTVHLKGFSPVCVLMCPCSSQGREKHLPQKWHLHPWLCVRTCIEYAGMLT